MKVLVRLIFVGSAAAFLSAPAAAQSYVGGAEAPQLLADFGGAMAVADGQLIVGEGGNTARPGMVYVHEREGGEWVRTQELTAPDAVLADGFGSTLAVAGTQMLVGAPDAVYVFSRSGTDWSGSGELEAPEEDTDFGVALATAGDVALVGAPEANGGAGAVHMYRHDGSTWTLAETIASPQSQAEGGFGSSVAVDGDFALVGAPGMDDGTGAVFAYRLGAGAPESLGRLPTAFLDDGARFGTTVAAVRGEVALASAPGDAGIGGVFAFWWNAEEDRFEQRGRWTAFDGVPQAGRRPGTAFGLAMAVAGDEVWVGSATGAYIFEVDDEFAITSARKERGGGIGGGFGSNLTAGDGIVAVAAPRADNGVGQVLVYEDGMEVATLGSEPDEFDRVAGGEVECSDAQAGAWECSDVNLVSYVPVSELSGDDTRGIRSNDNWGWEDPETGQKWALVGMTDRLSFVDVTDSSNPRVAGVLMMTEGANGSAWRDVKTFANHAFVVSDGAGDHGMQVFDLTRLRDLQNGEPQFLEPNHLYQEIASAHNIVINTDVGHAYIVGARGGGETCGGGLHIVDINDPLQPEFAGCFADQQTGRAGTGYTHDAQCVVYEGPDEEWAGRSICLGSNETALSIADVTDPANTQKISSATYPNVAYSHQGWLSDDHRWFYMNDELDEIGGSVERTRTLVWDLEDLDDPVLATEHLGVEESSDHNLYVVGDLMFQSNYRSGVRILDISDRAEPVEVGYFDTVPYGDNSAGTSGAWSNYPFFGDGMIIATGGSEGLFLLRPTILNTVF